MKGYTGLRKIANASGVGINPATEEKQDAVVALINDLDKYSWSNTDKDHEDQPNYYGFEATNGNWYILRVWKNDTSTSNNNSTGLYYAGSSDYETGWANRHDYFYESKYIIFGDGSSEEANALTDEDGNYRTSESGEFKLIE